VRSNARKEINTFYLFLTLPVPLFAFLHISVKGGYIAKRMGVPIGVLCAGVNANDITHRTVQTGKFHKSDGMKKTLSDAINIQIVRSYITALI